MNSNLTAMIEEKLMDAHSKLGTVNVLIAGRTGVGKSTLINSVFEGNYAATGQGRPVTRQTRLIRKKGFPLAIYDTRGLEMAKFNETLVALEGLISDLSCDPDPNKHIHLALICIHEDGRRVEDAEIQLHRMLAARVPVVGVVTKARSDQGFRQKVQSLLPQATNVVRVRSIHEELDDGNILPPMGLRELVEVSLEVLPEGQHRAFAAAQKASMALKVSSARKVVAGAALAAGGAGATPIPFSDAFLIAPIQIGMLARITASFGLNLSAGFLATMVTSLGGGAAATFGGRALVGGLVKMIPGVGAIAGGAISAGTAAALTTVLGSAYIAALERAVSANPEGGITPEQIAEEVRRGGESLSGISSVA